MFGATARNDVLRSTLYISCICGLSAYKMMGQMVLSPTSHAILHTVCSGHCRRWGFKKGFACFPSLVGNQNNRALVFGVPFFSPILFTSMHFFSFFFFNTLSAANTSFGDCRLRG